MKFNHILLPIVAAIVSVFLGSCDNSGNYDPGGSTITPTSESFEATTQPNTASVSMAAMASLESYDESTGRYTFQPEDEIMDLDPGKVVLFEGHSLRRVSSVNKENGRIVVNTEFAALTDYYKDARIKFSAPVAWDEEGISQTRLITGNPIATFIRPLPLSANTSAPASQGELGVSVERELRGWKIEFEMKPEAGGKLNMKLVAKKERQCSITAEGFISNFSTHADVEIADGSPRHVSYHNRGMSGEMEIKFAAVALGTDIAMLEIPAKLERTILVQGFIPVTLRLKANLKIYPEVAAGSSSQVSLKLTYDADMGFDYNMGRMKSEGDIRGASMQQTGESNTATAGIAGMGVGVEFPRFEIGILHNVIIPYMVLNTHTSSYLSTGLLDNTPCHFAEIKYDASVGVDLKFIGDAKIRYNYKIKEDKKRWISEGSHCD